MAEEMTTQPVEETKPDATPAETATATTAAPSKNRRRKAKRSLPKGTIFILSTFNNTIVNISDAKGNVLSWASAGRAGFKGSRKSTPYAAQMATEKVLGEAREFGLKEAEVIVKGIGSGRDSALRAIMASGVAVTSIKDTTGVPHNGCRPRKARRA